MSCKVAMALVALLFFCFPPTVLPEAANRETNRAAVVRRHASTVFGHPTEAVNYVARPVTADEKEGFAASPLVLCGRFSRSGGAGRTKPWIKLTAPNGEPVHINVDQIASVRHDTEMPGANTEVNFVSGKFQRVHENVEQVVQLISAISDAQGNEDRLSAALVCSGSILTQTSARDNRAMSSLDPTANIAAWCWRCCA